MQRVTYGSLVYYCFHSLSSGDGLVHGMFTRLGGYSRPPWDSLNTGHTVGDEPAAVDANHRAICEALGLPERQLVSPHQVHGTRVVAVGPADRGCLIERADALITAAPGVTLMLRFADCVPVWMHDPMRHAVGLAHAGWRGMVAGVVPETVRAMADTFGSQARDLRAGIGPSIGPCCYEVGPDVAEAVEEAFAWELETLLEPCGAGKWHLDLWSAIRQQLAGVGVEQIETAGICTACHTEEWFSHRAEAGKTGRMGAVIALQE
jgi:YfiH family protein